MKPEPLPAQLTLMPADGVACFGWNLNLKDMGEAEEAARQMLITHDLDEVMIVEARMILRSEAKDRTDGSL